VLDQRRAELLLPRLALQPGKRASVAHCDKLLRREPGNPGVVKLLVQRGFFLLAPRPASSTIIVLGHPGARAGPG